MFVTIGMRKKQATEGILPKGHNRVFLSKHNKQCDNTKATPIYINQQVTSLQLKIDKDYKKNRSLHITSTISTNTQKQLLFSWQGPL